MNENDKDPEVVSIYPHSMSESVGAREITEKIQRMKDLSASLKAITPPLGVSIGGRASGALKWGKSYEELRKYILPYHATVANASGTGNRAMWEFYQEEGMAAIGQFDLKIYLRIPRVSYWPQNGIIKHKYCIDWNLEVNHKRLVDHDIDLDRKWNMIVNGKPLMDRKEGNDNKNNEKWNVPLQHLAPKDQDKLKEKISKSMNEEEEKAEKLKLLRPLYLLQYRKLETDDNDRAHNIPYSNVTETDIK
jgi:hypothetical protein